jgi:hypothetical protein
MIVRIAVRVKQVGLMDDRVRHVDPHFLPWCLLK